MNRDPLGTKSIRLPARKELRGHQNTMMRSSIQRSSIRGVRLFVCIASSHDPTLEPGAERAVQVSPELKKGEQGVNKSRKELL